MIYLCNGCNKTTFETTCPWCMGSEVSPSSELTLRHLTPLDPSFYPDFQYRSKGLIKDFLGKKKEQAQLNDLLSNVLRKYSELKQPYFTNFIHTTRVSRGNDDAKVPGPRLDGTYTERELFREVLIRKGFDELEGQPSLLDKLLQTTAFNSAYLGFSRELSRHIRASLADTLRSWIEEAGTTFRSDLALFYYYIWANEVAFPNVQFNPQAASTSGVPLLPLQAFRDSLSLCEAIYFDILVERLGSQLEHFNPNQFITMYLVDAMDGFQFEAFLVEIFRTIGYDVKETKKTADQGADLFVNRFGKNMVIQAKNYSGTVGNAAVQQAISAKAFYGCDEAMVVTNSYYTKSAKELADMAGVRLIDRSGLQSYLDDYNQKLIEVFEVEEESA
ncbi:restriction endonuclease [Pseudomonas helleri]|uniref:Restriction endonuclease n=2 Tax=Pseudomonas TaxID=286 RepID=A0A6A7YJW0_9PSED|nr:restriction endonuclease [Pseudomonas helleri]MQT32909.1 restriction endonuclease [Pseudomonas helleri]MQT48429.1 restriction endonuclease [Pseudomonas helleri]MQT90483.1 restriction endonuclease [Pseudomonas helleri]